MPSFMRFAETTNRGRIALIVKRREAGRSAWREQMLQCGAEMRKFALEGDGEREVAIGSRRRTPTWHHRQRTMPRHRLAYCGDRSVGVGVMKSLTPNTANAKEIKELWFHDTQWRKMSQGAPSRSLNVARSSMSSTKEDKPWSREA